MPELTWIYDALSVLFPWECMKARFMQQAMLGLLLLAPMAAALGVQVVNFRMAFFFDAISHSAFAGAAIGLLFSLSPQWTMPVFAVLVGIWIMATQRRSSLSADTVIGVVFSAVVAFGLAMISRDRNAARNVQQFLYGDILTIQDWEIGVLALLFLVLLVFQTLGFNRLLYIGFSPTLAKTHRVKVAIYQFVFATLLSLVVIFSVRAVGVLLVTALMIIPAAAARNLARSAGGMFWWAVGIGLVAAVAGLLISAQDWARTATGATVVLCSFGWFMVSVLVAWRRGSGAG